MSDQDFLYDDFFSPEDAAPIPATIEVRGRTLPIGLRLLSFGDVRRLMNNNARVVIGEDGKPQIQMRDDTDGGDIDLVLSALKSWPFKNRDGSMVEINRKNLEDMQPDVLSALIQKVSDFAQTTIKAQTEGINGPFVKQSGEVS